MNNQNLELWQRIQSFELDDPDASFAFTARLARENSWTIGYAKRAVEEYKRFVFLAMVADHEVTPSDQVDQTWHLHLTYTRSYWNQLCKEVLQRPLHHGPTKGGKSEASRHAEQYERTLQSYTDHFGESPPADIWPPTEIRFGEDLHFVRVNSARAWVLPKPWRWRKAKSIAPLVVGAWVAPVLYGLVNPFDFTGPQFLAFFAVVIAIAIFGALALRTLLRHDDSDRAPAQLSTYEIACLGGGVPGTLRASLASLLLEKRLRFLNVVDPSTKLGMFTSKASLSPLAKEPLPRDLHPLERTMLVVANDEIGASTEELLEAGRPIAEMIHRKLQNNGLLETDKSFFAARWTSVAVIAAVWILGAVKLGVAISRGKPVMFLALALAGLAVIVYLFWKRPLRTPGGQRLFEKLRAENGNLKQLNLKAESDTARLPTIPIDSILLAAGLFGLTAMQHPDLDRLKSVLKPSAGGFFDAGCDSTIGSAGGCGAGGCGGGGCGGGGCGGCGG